MEFYEKLQELRKSRGLTQEELAQALYVSRTAVSKWESNRGYPSIDSLKDISAYFSVSIDDLLSSDKVISIAEKENKSNIRHICGMLYGIVDLFSIILVILPLYPKTVDGFVYAVNLMTYTETSVFNRYMYWGMFGVLMVCGAVKTGLIRLKISKGQNLVTIFSLFVNVVAVMYLSLAREPYAVTVAFMLLIVKGILVFKGEKTA